MTSAETDGYQAWLEYEMAEQRKVAEWADKEGKQLTHASAMTRFTCYQTALGFYKNFRRTSSSGDAPK